MFHTFKKRALASCHVLPAGSANQITFSRTPRQKTNPGTKANRTKTTKEHVKQVTGHFQHRAWRDNPPSHKRTCCHSQRVTVRARMSRQIYTERRLRMFLSYICLIVKSQTCSPRTPNMWFLRGDFPTRKHVARFKAATAMFFNCHRVILCDFSHVPLSGCARIFFRRWRWRIRFQ